MKEKNSREEEASCKSRRKHWCCCRSRPCCFPVARLCSRINKALNSGKIRAAGLDVYADEPATNKALYSHPNVSCTPHIGAATKEAQKRIGAEIVDIIESFGK